MRLFRETGADLFEHIVYRARWDAVAFKVDESHLLESVHNFFGCLPLLRERVCMSEFAKVDQGNLKCLIRPSVLSNKIKHYALEIVGTRTKAIWSRCWNLCGAPKAMIRGQTHACGVDCACPTLYLSHQKFSGYPHMWATRVSSTLDSNKHPQVR